jgi:crotonobetainyl-CoA:carnitine CoA-transferase CaiB-like acyl-CoA transferase
VGALAHHEQTRALELLQELGSRAAVRPPLAYDGDRTTWPAPPPELGEHTRDVLAEIGYDDDAVDALVAAGAIRC